MFMVRVIYALHLLISGYVVRRIGQLHGSDAVQLPVPVKGNDLVGCVI